MNPVDYDAAKAAEAEFFTREINVSGSGNETTGPKQTTVVLWKGMTHKEKMAAKKEYRKSLKAT